MNLGKLLSVLECGFHQCNGLVDSTEGLLGDVSRNLGKAVDKRFQKEQDRVAVDSCADCTWTKSPSHGLCVGWHSTDISPEPCFFQL